LELFIVLDVYTVIQAIATKISIFDHFLGSIYKIKVGFINPLDKGKDPGPEGPALVHPGGVIWMITSASSVQVSGVSNRLRPAGSESPM